jgi:hypothetical protein
MWCRFLEISHSFRDEMGHATFGYGEKFSQVRSHQSGPAKSRPTFVSLRRRRHEQEEDEIELAALPQHSAANDTRVESNGAPSGQWSDEGIMQRKSYEVEIEHRSA